jgi:hypothetical protein
MADPYQNRRTEVVAHPAAVRRRDRKNSPHLQVRPTARRHPKMHEVQAGDGPHPGAAGYSVLADLLAALDHLDHGRPTNDEDPPLLSTISLQPGR